MRALDYATGACAGGAVIAAWGGYVWTCVALTACAILLAIASWTREEEE